jgi:protein translocase SecG subunit
VITLLLAAASPAAAAAPAAKATSVPLPSALQNFNYSFVPKSWLAEHAAWLTHTFAGIFIISAILLVFLLAIQTTKNEGLTGTLGGRVDSAYKGRLGFEGQIQRVTTVIAVTFVIFATLISISGI